MNRQSAGQRRQHSTDCRSAGGKAAGKTSADKGSKPRERLLCEDMKRVVPGRKRPGRGYRSEHFEALEEVEPGFNLDWQRYADSRMQSFRQR